jgi:hypothetical protein
MNETMLPTQNPLHKVRRNFLLLIPAILLFVALTGWQIWRLSEASKPQLQSNGVPINVAMEERFGVRITGVHIVGRSGLVDVRYRVLDVGKAKNFGHFTETSPLLIAEENGKTVEVTIMGLHNHRVEAGRSYYILYRNTNKALEPGSTVTLVIDDLLLEHIPVQ